MNASPLEELGPNSTEGARQALRREALKVLLVKAEIERRWPVLKKRERTLIIWMLVNILWSSAALACSFMR